MISAHDAYAGIVEGDGRRCYGAPQDAKHLPAVPLLEPLPAADATPRQLLGDLTERETSCP
jgi:hypothetical protein